MNLVRLHLWSDGRRWCHTDLSAKVCVWWDSGCYLALVLMVLGSPRSKTVISSMLVMLPLSENMPQGDVKKPMMFASCCISAVSSSCKHVPPVNPGEDKRKPYWAAEWKHPPFLPLLRQWSSFEICWPICKSVNAQGNHIMQEMEIEKQKWVWIQDFIWI